MQARTHTHAPPPTHVRAPRHRAFSATGAIEGINAIQTGELLTLSEVRACVCGGGRRS